MHLCPSGCHVRNFIWETDMENSAYLWRVYVPVYVPVILTGESDCYQTQGVCRQLVLSVQIRTSPSRIKFWLLLRLHSYNACFVVNLKAYFLKTRSIHEEKKTCCSRTEKSATSSENAIKLTRSFSQRTHAFSFGEILIKNALNL